jgi:LEA14-like dessication related protein
MSMRFRSLLAALVLVLPLSACAGAFRQPEVRLDGISVASLGFRGGMLYADVEVTNPNRFDVQASALSYTLQLADASAEGGWVRFAEGVVPEPVRLQRRGATIIRVPIQFRFEDMAGAARSMLDTGTFNYRITGDVRLVEPIGRTVPFQRTGVVTMSGIRD